MGALSLRAAKLGAVVVTAVTLTAATACSGTGSGDASGSAGLTGEPILIGSSAPETGQVYNTPEQPQGLRAAVAAINAAGGINGRPLQLEFCDGKFDPNAEINCARQLVSKKVVATVMPQFQADASDTAYKILDGAGIPMIGTDGHNPAGLTAANSYMLSSGLPGWFAGAMSALVSGGATKIAILVGPTPSAQFSGKLMADALDSAGITDHVTVTFDPKADPTGATAAAKATADGVDGVGLAMATSGIPVIVSAMRRGGYTGQIASVSSIITPAVIKAMGPDAEGIKLTSQIAFTTDSANKGVAEYTANLKALDPAAQPQDIGMFSWSAVQLFSAVAKGLPTVDQASVKTAFDSLAQPIDIGTVAPWSIAGKTSPMPAYPRILNPNVQVGVVTNGVVVPDGKGFINPFSLLATTSGSSR